MIDGEEEEEKDDDDEVDNDKEEKVIEQASWTVARGSSPIR